MSSVSIAFTAIQSCRTSDPYLLPRLTDGSGPDRLAAIQVTRHDAVAAVLVARVVATQEEHTMVADERDGPRRRA